MNKYLKWVCIFPLNLIMSIVKYPMAIIAVLFFSTPDRRYLTWAKWLETIDNDLSGDGGWKSEHLSGSDPLSSKNRIRWLWRNGGNTLNYTIFGCKDLSEWREAQDQSSTFFKRPDGYWLIRRFINLSTHKRLDIQIGWNIMGPQLGLCKYVLNVRIRSF